MIWKILDYHLDLMMKIEMMIMLLLMMMTLAIKKIDKNWKWNLINLNHHHHGKFFCLLKIPLTFTMFASLSNGLINSSSSKNKTYRLKSLTITFISKKKKIDNFPLLFFKWNKSFYRLLAKKTHTQGLYLTFIIIIIIIIFYQHRWWKKS